MTQEINRKYDLLLRERCSECLDTTSTDDSKVLDRARIMGEESLNPEMMANLSEALMWLRINRHI